ncbi:MAG: putative sugar nucleotidyl transferase [Bacteroidetes bacterium]|nr:putative sugar nucleotidyl transferase [Bacteroidota bacterium]
MTIILYESEKVNSLFPITLTMCASDIFCAGITLTELIEKTFPKTKIIKLNRNYLQQSQFKIPKNETEILFMNSNLAPHFDSVIEFKNNLKNKSTLFVTKSNSIIGAYLNIKGINLQELNLLTPLTIDKFLLNLNLNKTEVKWQMFEHIWQLVTFNKQMLQSNLEYLKKGFIKKGKNFYTGKNVILPKKFEVDSTNGTILISSGVKIFPFVFLEGPVFIGENCLVKEFASIKDATSIGKICKIGGEVEASVFHSYSNKQHTGFIGHSYIGRWINLGAGTTNSDLKNTYSKIKIKGSETGEQFLGCFIGDYSKSAINTSIYTGKIIGVNSYLYGTVTKDVPSFTNYASQQNIKEVPFEVALKVQKAVFARRKKIQTKEDELILREIYSSTKSERIINNVKAGKFSL